MRIQVVDTGPPVTVNAVGRLFERIDLRNHRKLAVIDGRAAYTGSQNVVRPDYGKKGVGLMLVPGWDFFLDYIQHGHIAILRGVESGFSIVRSAKGGSLYVSDDRGRILAETTSDSAPFATLLVTVPAAHDETFYDTMGGWFAYLSILMLAIVLVRLYVLRKKP